MARKHREKIAAWYHPPEEVICPLCGREIRKTSVTSTIWCPKAGAGGQTQTLHRICHRQIHALFSEAELETSYATVEALVAHPEMAKFITWVAKKPPGFFDGTAAATAQGKCNPPHADRCFKSDENQERSFSRSLVPPML